MLQLAKEGAPLTKMLDEVPSLVNRNLNNLHGLRDIYMKHRNPADDPPQCMLFWGESGAGKTKAAWEAAMEHVQGLGTYEDAMDGIYIKPPGKWWDGYCQQPVVILDDFNGKFFDGSNKGTLAFMQRLMDRYPLFVEIKGTTAKFNSPVIIVTSNQGIEEWFPEIFESTPEWLTSLKRRFTQVKHFTRTVFNPDAVVIEDDEGEQSQGRQGAGPSTQARAQQALPFLDL